MFKFKNWVVETEGWDHATGAPGIVLVSNAIQAWSMLNQRATSVAEASRVFNMVPAHVIEAVEDHAWMFLDGPRDDYERLMIEYEGE